MIIVESVSGMQHLSLKTRASGRLIGLVPTMGALHKGHLSLVRQARERCDFVVLSIFVNPAQFGPGEDYDAYPRDFERDCSLCSAEDVDVIFAPSANEVYSDDSSTCVTEKVLSSGLCGRSRPGHFNGVVTIVAKLFNMVMPDVAVFGQKDAQQVRVIKRMVRDLNFPVEIVIAPTVREPDGLAMSSRNIYLSAEERKSALCVYESLCMAEHDFKAGETNVEVLRNRMLEIIGRHSCVDVDYVDFVDDVTLMPVRCILKNTLVAVAANVGKARLIDNIVLSV